MYMEFWFNGKFVTQKHIQLSPYDHGLLYGHGGFETFRSYSGKVPFLHYHYTRLLQTMNGLGITFPYSEEVIKKAIYQLLTRFSGSDCLLRLTVTAGEWQEDGYSKPSVWLTAAVLGKVKRGIEKRGKWLTVQHQGRADRLDVRGLHYSDLRSGQMELADSSKYEGLLLNKYGIVTESVRSNIFWVKNDILYTPCLSLGIVKGITRQWVITLAKEIGIKVREGEFDREELEGAHECFLTNAVDELIPLKQVGQQQFAGNEGLVYNRLHQAYAYIIEQQLKGDSIC